MFVGCMVYRIKIRIKPYPMMPLIRDDVSRCSQKMCKTSIGVVQFEQF